MSVHIVIELCICDQVGLCVIDVSHHGPQFLIRDGHVQLVHHPPQIVQLQQTVLVRVCMLERRSQVTLLLEHESVELVIVQRARLRRIVHVHESSKVLVGQIDTTALQVEVHLERCDLTLGTRRDIDKQLVNLVIQIDNGRNVMIVEVVHIDIAIQWQ